MVGGSVGFSVNPAKKGYPPKKRHYKDDIFSLRASQETGNSNRSWANNLLASNQTSLPTEPWVF